VQQRGGQRGRPLRRLERGRRAEPVRQPHGPRSARDDSAEQPERQQDAAHHAVAARDQSRAQPHQVLDRLDGARQVAARAAGSQLDGPVIAGQSPQRLGRRAELGQDAAAVIQPRPGQRPEHRGGIPPAHDPDVKPAGHDPALARPALGGCSRLPRAADDGVRQPDRVGRRDGDHPRLRHGVGEFQVDRVRQDREDLAVTARPAEQVAGGQAGHAGGHGQRTGARAGRGQLRTDS
jgi:hypothetical protein